MWYTMTVEFDVDSTTLGDLETFVREMYARGFNRDTDVTCEGKNYSYKLKINEEVYPDDYTPQDKV